MHFRCCICCAAPFWLLVSCCSQGLLFHGITVHRRKGYRQPNSMGYSVSRGPDTLVFIDNTASRTKEFVSVDHWWLHARPLSRVAFVCNLFGSSRWEDRRAGGELALRMTHCVNVVPVGATQNCEHCRPYSCDPRMGVQVEPFDGLLVSLPVSVTESHHPVSLSLSCSCQFPLSRSAQVQRVGHHCPAWAARWLGFVELAYHVPGESGFIMHLHDRLD